MDSHFLLQEILSIHGLHPCLLHCRQIHYCWATSSTHTYTHTDTPHFLHSSIYGHLGCVSVLAVVNTIWTQGCLFKLEFCLVIGLGVGLLGHMATLFLVFWGTVVLFSIVDKSIYIITTQPLQHLLFVDFFDDALLSSMKWCLTSDLHFSCN